MSRPITRAFWLPNPTCSSTLGPIESPPAIRTSTAPVNLKPAPVFSSGTLPVPSLSKVMVGPAPTRSRTRSARQAVVSLAAKVAKGEMLANSCNEKPSRWPAGSGCPSLK
jgi:hypothetical protein